MSRFVTAAAVAAVVVSLRGAGGQSIGADQTVARIGHYVAQYYARAQSIVSDETVIVQPLGRDFTFNGFARRLVYELRVEWNPTATGDDAPATVTRQLLTVNGKPPRPGDKPECMDPRGVSPEPLAFLLPDRQHEYAFTAAGIGRVDGRTAVMVDYRSLEAGEPEAEWRDECVSIELPGRSRGRVWADPQTAEILRVDEQLTGMVDVPIPFTQQRRGAPMFMTIERADTSILYRPVIFRDPDETLLLPATITTLAIVRNSGVPRVRITQSLGNYRRFVTASRIVR